MGTVGLEYLSKSVFISGQEKFGLLESEDADWNALTEEDADKIRMIGRDCDKVLQHHQSLIASVYAGKEEAPEYERDQRLWQLLAACVVTVRKKEKPSAEERATFRRNALEYGAIISDIGGGGLYDHLLWRHVPDCVE